MKNSLRDTAFDSDREEESSEFDESDANSYTNPSMLEDEDAPSSGWKLDNKCYACSRSFTFKRRRHHCRKCANSVCGKHSCLRAIANKVKTVRICDACDRKLLEEEYSNRYEEDAKHLRDDIEKEKAIKQELTKQKEEQEDKTHRAKVEMESYQRQNKRREADIELDLKEAKIKTESADKEYQEFLRKLSDLQREHKEIKEQLASLEKEIVPLKDETSSSRERKDEMISQIDDLTVTLRGSLQIDQLKSVLCDSCIRAVEYRNKPMSVDEALENLRSSSTGFLSTKNSFTPKLARR
jgi:hypothetical protein